MARNSHPGLVSKGSLKTAIGQLNIDSTACVDSVEISSFGEVKLYFSLNHKSEDVEMSMEYRLSPEDARGLAKVLMDAADSAEENPYSHSD